MDENLIYATADNVLGFSLKSRDFHVRQPGEYIRRMQSGCDRIMVSMAPLGKGVSSFAVYLSHYPDDMSCLLSLLGAGEDEGFPCGPFLTPEGVSGTPRYWRSRNAEQLAESLRNINISLEERGIPWLESLHDPVVYAQQVDKQSLLWSALSFERIGDFSAAREFYEGALQRFSSVFANISWDQARGICGKRLIFCSAKLGVGDPRCERLALELGYAPHITPLPHH